MNREESLDTIVIDSYTISDLASLIFPAYDLETGEREPKKYLVSWSGWPIGSSPTYGGAKDIIENHRKEELMSKRTEYSIQYFHFSHGEAMESLSELCTLLEALLPEYSVDFESCKSDYGLLTITREEEFEDGDYK